MKKIVTLTLLTLSAIPFGFWKMESGPCCQFYDIDYCLEPDGEPYPSPPIILKKYLEQASFAIIYIFNYNKETGYAIAYTKIFQEKSINQCFEFFKEGDPSIFKANHTNSFIFIEEIPNLKMTYNLDWLEDISDAWYDNGHYLWTNEEQCFNPQGVLKPGLLKGTSLFLKNSSIGENVNSVLKKDFLKERAVKLSTEYRTFSGVTITNKGDHVEIIQQGKQTKDLQKALQDHLDIHHRNTRIAQTLPFDRPTSARLLKLLQNENRPTSKQIDLLNNSQILSVFGIFKKGGTESIIWGLAQNKETKEKFHWITDLKTDISFLMEE